MKNSGIPPAPKHLSREAKGWWRRFNSALVFEDSALLLLESALESFDRMREAQHILATEGTMLTDRFGQRKAHPATLVERDAKMVMLRMLKATGVDLEPLAGRVGRPSGAAWHGGK
jgi:P27 family predicted phage terminase small subunit